MQKRNKTEASVGEVNRVTTLINEMLAESLSNRAQSPEEVAGIVSKSMSDLFKGKRDPEGYSYEVVGHNIGDDGEIILHISKGIEYIHFTGTIDTSLLDTFINPNVGESIK